MEADYQFSDGPQLSEYLNKQMSGGVAPRFGPHDHRLITRGDPSKVESNRGQRRLGCSLVNHIRTSSLVPDELTVCLRSYRKNGITPWDIGHSQPPLRDLLVSGKVSFPAEGRALVPGCGTVSAHVQSFGTTMLLDHLGL